MSTRSIIVFKGVQPVMGYHRIIRLYQHCDGYPTGVLPELVKVIRKGKRLVKEYSDRMPRPVARPDKQSYRVGPETLAGLYIGEQTNYYGTGPRMEYSGTGPDIDRATMLGNQGDLEWVYIVDTDQKTVVVLGGGYTGNTPDTFDVIDPSEYAKHLTEEYQSKELAEIEGLKKALAKIGWPVNR